MKRLGIIAVIAIASLTSCTHKELCPSHHHTARVRIDTDWSEFTVERPTGMSVNVYGEDGKIVRAALSNTLTHVDLELEPGRYSALAYNQSPSEFGTLRFESMDTWDEAAVMADYTKSLWYKSGEDEPVIFEPEWFGTDRGTGLTVTMPMLEASDAIRRTKAADFPMSNVIATLTPKNVIYTITVRVRIQGIHNLKAARASLNGLAAGFLLGQGHQSAATGTQLLEEWTLTRDSSDPTIGWIKAVIASFGLPHGHKGQAAENTLSLSLLLVDNKTKLDFSFPVGDSFRKNADSELELSIEKELEDRLPDVKPENGSDSGFDATVDDWGDEEIIDIPV